MLKNERKWQKNFLCIMVICAGIIFLCFSEEIYHWLVFIMLIGSYLGSRTIKKGIIKRWLIIGSGVVLGVAVVAFYLFKMIPFYQLYGETGRLIATQSNYFNPVSNGYLSDNLIYTLVKDRDVIISANGEWCKKYIEALAGSVEVDSDIDGYEEFVKQNSNILFTHVGGMTLAVNSDLYEESTLQILKNKRDLANINNYLQLYIVGDSLYEGIILLMTDANYNMYVMPYEVYLNE